MIRAGEHAASGQKGGGQVRAAVGGGGIQAVDHHPVAARPGGGVDELPAAQEEGDMAGEVEQIAGGQAVQGDLTGGEAGDQPGVPVEADAAEKTRP